MFIEVAIDALLGITPVPGLSAAFTAFKYIVSTVKAVQDSKEQLSTLAKALGQLLATLDKEFKSSVLIEASCVKPLNDLESLLEEVSKFVEAEKERGFLKSLFHAEARIASIEMFYHRIGTTASAFQISAMIGVQHYLQDNERARTRDVDALNSRFNVLEKDNSELRRTLQINQNNMIAMMVSIERRMEGHRNLGHPEQKFYSHTLQYLTSTSGRQVKLEDWMISPFDVECGPEIGVGGFGTVFKGTWDSTEVAIKFLHNSAGVRADTAMLRKEIDIWKNLRHPNILQFLGGNTLDDDPFMVMPLIPHTSREFLQINPDFDPLYILRDVSLGIEYLHGRKICHGDLKGINILVEASGRALLCDFGLTQIKTDITTRTHIVLDTGVPGSRNWMAPELLSGSSLRPKSDIYAFGMTLYELYTDEIPMWSIPYVDFFNVVVTLGGRPQRPEEDVCPRMTDGVWSLAEGCWDKSARARPTARQIHDTIKILLLRQTSAATIDHKRSKAEEEVVSPTRPPLPPVSPSLPLTRVAKEGEKQAREGPQPEREAERVHREDEHTVKEGAGTTSTVTGKAEDAKPTVEIAPAVPDDNMQHIIKEKMAGLNTDPCSAGYDFVGVDGGYQCNYGCHFVSFEQLGMK
ncbi:kinase-like domain-containing protein [Mycena galericulata]|nr:kinase-like domain-containing protein [Mycena galericulata]